MPQDIEERFSSTKAGYRFQFFAPSNEAFARIPEQLLSNFSLPQNYPLLLSLLRAHLAEVPAAQTTIAAGESNSVIQSVEGYPLHISAASGEAYVEAGYYRSQVNLSGIAAENGVVYKISRFLDPYASSFGIALRNGTGKATVLDASPKAEGKTMTDLVLAEPQLSNWTAIITEVLYGIMKRLGDRRGPEGVTCTTPHPFAILPSNTAFDLLPSNYTKLLRAPFNFALSSHLLAWSLTVPTCATFEDIMTAIRTEGEFKIFSHRADINLTIYEPVKGSGELFVNNARIMLANRCAGNGCIWIADRLVDPVFGMF
ncbi:hypothetical protein EJ06DRAFT_372337 [Trichodelitschia bisporula]|uniref:FAS1 domain-containing protein n=1 Tax=Trichodelitschia bisporula TaxID=703511 RepID=A0A6G1I1P0_9PEZI|nr:hypothetical protein EJ06DRAFT_372337 [Trichodelitschia bisporula]